jgi:3-methylcrotonyl-CoA carboxylase alpha subunit
MPETVHAAMSAQVGQVLVGLGESIEDGSPLVILEWMNTDFPVTAHAAGVVVYLHVVEGDDVRPGQPLVDLSTE